MVLKKRLEGKHFKAILMLVAGDSTEEITKATGASRKALEGWKRDPEFNRIYQQALSQCFDAGMSKFVQGVDRAVDKILQIIDDPDVSSRTKLAACMFLITHSNKLVDKNLQLRLEDIEESLENDGTITISSEEIREESAE